MILTATDLRWMEERRRAAAAVATRQASAALPIATGFACEETAVGAAGVAVQAAASRAAEPEQSAKA